MKGSTQSLRIIVTGLIAQHARLGGVAWDYVQYPAALRRMGHDVYYVEDSGEWPYTLDGGESGHEWIAHDPAVNVRHLARVMERFDLADRWAYHFPIKRRWFGMAGTKRRNVLATADLLINVSGSLLRPSDYRSVKRLAYIDSDPVFTQIKLASPRGHWTFQKRVKDHDVHFSFGETLCGNGETPYTWRPTRQPILLAEWTSRAIEPRPVYTTVMSWASYRPLYYRRERYGQKDIEFRRYVGLPAAVPGVTFEVALNATEHAGWESGDSTGRRVPPRQLLSESGWRVVDALTTCSDLDDYRSFIQTSKAEWSVAKNGYVKGRSGWFSCRSACYLAAGRPVVVQDTGFGAVLPVGEGIVPFTTPEEAAAASQDVCARYERHAQAALAIAHEYFDSTKVLGHLVERAMAPHSG